MPTAFQSLHKPGYTDGMVLMASFRVSERANEQYSNNGRSCLDLHWQCQHTELIILEGE